MVPFDDKPFQPRSLLRGLVFALDDELKSPSIEGSLLHKRGWFAMNGVASCMLKILPISLILRQAQKEKEGPEKTKTAAQDHDLNLEDECSPDATLCRDSSDPFNDLTVKVHTFTQVSSSGGPLLPP